jgi:hypothetical protein
VRLFALGHFGKPEQDAAFEVGYVRGVWVCSFKVIQHLEKDFLGYGERGTLGHNYLTI